MQKNRLRVGNTTTNIQWFLEDFFSLGFRQWRSRADRVESLKIKIRLPLFWIT